MIKDDSQKNPTFIAFFNLLLVRVKAEIMLISSHFLMGFSMALQPPPPSPQSSPFTATSGSVQMKDVEVVDSSTKLHLHVTFNSGVFDISIVV